MKWTASKDQLSKLNHLIFKILRKIKYHSEHDAIFVLQLLPKVDPSHFVVFTPTS